MRWQRALVYTLAALLWVMALAGLWNTVQVIAQYPYQLDREEGFLLYQAMELRAGRSFYLPINEYPFIVGTYNPLYLVLYAIGVAIAGPSMAVGRIIVLLFTLGIAGIMGTIVWSRTRELCAALLAPALFLTTWDLNDWVRYARVDLPALFFGLAGFAVVICCTRRWTMVVAGVLFTAAFYTKQTQLIAPLAAVLALLMNGRRKDAAVLAGTSAGLALFLLLVLNISTGGEFWRHTVVANANVMEWWQVRVWVKHLIVFDGLKVLAALLVAVACWRLIPRDRQPERFALTALVVYTTVALLSILQVAKRGSAVNYLLESQALIATTAAFGVGILLNLERRIALWALLVLIFLHAALTIVVNRPYILKPPPPDHQAEDLLVMRAMTSPGEVLAEIPIYAILARKEVYYHPFIMTQLAYEGKWEQAPFVSDLRSARFSLIISTANFEKDALMPGWTPEMAAAINGAYIQTEVVRDVYGRATYLYEPRTP